MDRLQGSSQKEKIDECLAALQELQGSMRRLKELCPQAEALSEELGQILGQAVESQEGEKKKTRAATPTGDTKPACW